MATVELRGIEKIFPGDVQAVKELSLTVEDGELLVLVGPSGCGKSTVLRMIAGLEEVTSGEILIDGKVVNDQSPQERNIAMVFQNYALYPHKTVRANLDFPLRMMGRSKQDRRRRVSEVAEVLGLAELLDKRPRALSGGQRQRVAMGRAMVRQPRAFLLDEPLSNLDAKLRVQIRSEIAQLQARMGTTTIYVTHDQVEAMTLGHRVAVLLDGRLQQADTGQCIYDNPANMFVAGFIGSPAMNVFATRLAQSERGPVVQFAEQRLPVPRELRDTCQLDRYENRPLYAGLRPEAFTLAKEAGSKSIAQDTNTENAASDTANAVTFTAKVYAVEALGHENIVFLESPVKLRTEYGQGDGQAGSQSGSAATSQTDTLATRLPAGAPPSPGDRLQLAIDTAGLCLFDQEGRSLRH